MYPELMFSSRINYDDVKIIMLSDVKITFK